MTMFSILDMLSLRCFWENQVEVFRDELGLCICASKGRSLHFRCRFETHWLRVEAIDSDVKNTRFS